MEAMNLSFLIVSCFGGPASLFQPVAYWLGLSSQERCLVEAMH